MATVRPILDCHLPYYLPTLVGCFFVYITEFHHMPILHLWIDYVVFPVLDLIFGEDHINPTPSEEKILKKQFRWQLPIISYVILEWFCFFWSFSYLQRNELSPLDFILFSISIAHVNAEGILVSHELFHKKSALLQFIGTLNLIKSLNMHFYSEHIYGHHKYVATPEDPATAKFNQTLFDFIKQSIKGGLINSWNREAKKMRKSNRPVISIYNKMVQFIGVEVVFLLLIFYFSGFKCLIFFVFQAYLSVSILETINYVRHYGLVRKKMENGEYEPVSIKHSWNAPQLVQNYLLFKLQRHSDHHANSQKPYQILYSPKDAPSLPCGYAVCLLACHFPNFWFEIINPLVETTNKSGFPSQIQMDKSTSALQKWIIYEVAFVSLLTYLVVFIL